MAKRRKNSGSQSLEKKVRDWLADEGFFRQKIQDPHAEFNFVIEYPPGTKNSMHIVQPEGKDDLVLVAHGIRLAPEHKSKYDGLSKKKQREFMDEMKFGLLFKQTGSQPHPSVDDLQEFRLVRLIYTDGLTKNSLMEAITEAHHCFLFISWKFVQKFGDVPGSAPGPSMHG